ncbi:MAG: glycosyltransferase family protein [Acidimicrobiales bacterium]
MNRPTLIFSGMIAATPGQGGATWAVLQYLLGFRALGWDVWFVEPAQPDGAAYCEAVMRQFGFDDRWVLVGPDGGIHGCTRNELDRAAGRADVLVNVSGMLTDPHVLDRVPTRVYLDLDPTFVQLWHAVEGVDMRFDAHTQFVTIADTVGAPESPIPACGRSWISTLPPVVLDEWPVAERLDHDALTTVAHWRGYGSIHHDGVHYGQKAHSLRPLLDLPTRTPARFLLALGIHPDETADLDALDANGWERVDPATVAATPDDYRRFVAGSKAELGIAKQGYIVSNSGWFSDRSACYLASGRPVVAQDTGFGRRLPTGKGLFAFRDADDAVAAIDELNGDYERHRAAAREIAETYLDARIVLRSLLERVLG